jgi:hypothetical protein
VPTPSGPFAGARVRIAITALGAVLGLGLAALPATVSAAVSGRTASTAHTSSAAFAAGAKAGGPGAAQAAVTRLAQRAKLAARANAAAKVTGSISGTVLGAERQPIAGACVTAVSSSRSVTATAAPDGTFDLAGLAPGSYALLYRDCAAAGRYFPAWSGGVAWRSAAARVQVSANQVHPVPTMVLKPTREPTLQSAAAQFKQMLAAASGRGLSAAATATTGRISGRVTGNGKPLSGICVAALPVTNGEGYGAVTDSSGRYSIRFVHPGRYRVVFAIFGCPDNGNWLGQVYPGDNNPFAGFGQGGTPVTVTAGLPTRNINGNLRRGGQISGTVTAKSGARLGGICANVTGNVPGGQVGYGVPTSPRGTYVVHALFPGKYSVQFVDGCGNAGNYAPATHRPVKVAYGSKVTGVNGVLGPGASVTGTVTLGTSSGPPLAGMCVFASNADGSVSMQTATGTDGSYQVVGLGTDTYQLQIGPGCDNGGNYTSTLLTVQTTAGQQTSGANAVLQPGATISGTVTDRKGRPVPNMCINIVELQGASSNFIGGFGVGTAADGTYLANGLDAGTYQLGVTGGCGNTANYAPYWYNNQPDESTATPIVLATGGSQTINPRLLPGAAIAGTVTDASGHGLAGICVSASTSSQAEIGPVFAAQTMTGTLGRYTIAGLTPGQYLLRFGCGQGGRYAGQWFGGATPELVSAPPGRDGGFNVVLGVAGAISGVVTGASGHPLAGTCAFAYASNNFASALGAVNLINTPTTNAHGAYRISGLAAGSYDVLFEPCNAPSAYAEQWYRHGSAAVMTAVRVRAGQVTSGINQRLVIGGTVSGRTVDSVSNPLPDICVFAFDPSTTYAGIGTSGGDGRYTITPLPTGHYLLEFFPCGTGDQNLIPVLSQVTVTAPHAVTGVNASMLPGGSVSGTVTAAASSTPVANECVEVISSDPTNLGSFAITGSDGTYQAPGLAAGTYQVFFGDPTCIFTTTGFAPQWYNGKSTQATADPVTVAVGQTTPSISAALGRDGQITGTVSDPSNAPLSGICVTAVPDSANLAGTLPVVAVSHASGYKVAGLVPGDYTVEFSAGCGASGYLNQWWQDAVSATAATPVSVAANQVVTGISAAMAK